MPSSPPVSIVKSVHFSSTHSHPTAAALGSTASGSTALLDSSVLKTVSTSNRTPITNGTAPPKPIVSTSDSTSTTAAASGSTTLLESSVFKTVSTSNQTPITNGTHVSNTPETHDLANAGPLVADNKSETVIESGDKPRPGRKRKAGAAPGKMRVTDSKTAR